jgi:hypothetical protein
MNNEPVIIEGITAMAFAIFGGWLVQHGITQAGANTALSAIVGGVAAAWGAFRLVVARSQVTPTAKLTPPAAPPAAPSSEPFRPV